MSKRAKELAALFYSTGESGDSRRYESVLDIRVYKIPDLCGAFHSIICTSDEKYVNYFICFAYIYGSPDPCERPLRLIQKRPLKLSHFSPFFYRKTGGQVNETNKVWPAGCLVLHGGCPGAVGEGVSAMQNARTGGYHTFLMGKPPLL